MPEITDTTPRTAITIAGETFNVAQPYNAGHPLTSAEAAALNQTFAENVRNNMAQRAKVLKEAGTYDQAVFQGTVDDYVNDYEFGVRTGGGRSSDPVQAEAMNLAREAIRKAIVRKGKALKDYSAAQISEMAKKQLAKATEEATVKIFDLARARVEAAREITDIEVDSVDEGDGGAEAVQPKRGKATAEATA